MSQEGHDYRTYSILNSIISSLSIVINLSIEIVVLIIFIIFEKK